MKEIKKSCEFRKPTRHRINRILMANNIHENCPSFQMWAINIISAYLALFVLQVFDNGLPIHACNTPLFSLTSVQLEPLFSWIAPLQVLLAKACPCGSAALFFFIFYWLTFVYIEWRGGYKLLLLFEFGSIMVFLKYLCCIGHGLNARKNYIV